MGQNCCKSKPIEEEEEEDEQITNPPIKQSQQKDNDDGQSNLDRLYEQLSQSYDFYLDHEFSLPNEKSKIVQEDNDAIMKFDVFLQFYQESMIWNKILFLKQKHSFLKQRRQLMKENSMVNYAIACLNQNRQDENCMQLIIDDFLKKMGIDESYFQKSMIHHMQNVENMQKISKLKNQIEENKFENPKCCKIIVEKINKAWSESAIVNTNDLDRKELIEIHKILHQISIDHLKELKQLPIDKLQNELALIQQVLADKLCLATGIETEDLDAQTEKLNLEQDDEYMQMVKDYTAIVQNIKLGQ